MFNNGLKLILWVFVFLLGYMPSYGQLLRPAPWQNSFNPVNTFDFSEDLLRQSLDQTVSRWSSRSNSDGVYLQLPLPDGTARVYQIWQSEQMASELAAKFPNINTYFGQDPSDPRRTLHITTSRKGVKVLFFDHAGQQYALEPINEHLAVYQFVYPQAQPEVARLIAACTAQLHEEDNRFENAPIGVERRGETKLFRYRLALACTGEYGSYHGTSKEEVLIAMNELLSQVNAIFEREVSIHFDLVANNEQLIFLDPETDPYDNTDVENLLETNKMVCNYAVGYPNFDLGHVLATKFGGQAQIGSICNFSRKAKAFSGLEQPEGYYMGAIFAHELAHQMGAQHTQSNDCNRNLGTAFEPGSGSTLMAYAGICAPNVQSLPDDYFHGTSLELITRKAAQGIIFGCVPGSKTDNLPPVADAGPDLYIPIGTPFLLEGSASDPNGDSLSYLWEQVDISIPGDTLGLSGPMFRSRPPSTSPIREFGARDDLWEQLPQSARKATFRLTVRDHHLGLGSTVFDEMTVHFMDTLGPLTITSPNTAELDWATNSRQNVEWEVNGTDQEPVNCDSVTIFLSTDGGLTYPLILAEKIPNSGSFSVTIPEIAGTNNRIKVSCGQAPIFDVSDISFVISDPNAPIPVDTVSTDTLVIPPADTGSTVIDTVVTPVPDTLETPISDTTTTPIDTIPDIPVDTISSTPQDTVPEMPVDTIPETPVDTIPNPPQDTTPDPPIDSIPDIPVDTIVQPPGDSLPDLPLDTIPDIPEDTLSTPPIDTVPEIPMDTISQHPVDTIPVPPQDTLVSGNAVGFQDLPGNGMRCKSCYSSIDLAPNPTFGSVYLRVKLEKPALTQFILINSQGKVLEERKLQLSADVEVVNWDLKSYPGGMYWFKMIAEGQVWVKPLVLKQ